MSIPASTYRVVFGGSMYGGEVWESGFWVHGDTIESQATANATASLWAGVLLSPDASGALRISLAAFASADVTVNYVKIYAYPTGGPVATYIGEFTPPAAGGTGQRTLPNQCCLVISERTGFAGRRYRGRMYLPAGKTGAGSFGQMTQAAIQESATAWALAFHDWNAVDGNGTVVVVSTTGTLFTPVSQVIVDSKIDIQRRRANKEQALYTALGNV